MSDCGVQYTGWGPRLFAFLAEPYEEVSPTPHPRSSGFAPFSRLSLSLFRFIISRYVRWCMYLTTRSWSTAYISEKAWILLSFSSDILPTGWQIINSQLTNYFSLLLCMYVSVHPSIHPSTLPPTHGQKWLCQSVGKTITHPQQRASLTVLWVESHLVGDKCFFLHQWKLVFHFMVGTVVVEGLRY